MRSQHLNHTEASRQLALNTLNTVIGTMTELRSLTFSVDAIDTNEELEDLGLAADMSILLARLHLPKLEFFGIKHWKVRVGCLKEFVWRHGTTLQALKIHPANIRAVHDEEQASEEFFEALEEALPLLDVYDVGTFTSDEKDVVLQHGSGRGVVWLSAPESRFGSEDGMDESEQSDESDDESDDEMGGCV